MGISLPKSWLSGLQAMVALLIATSFMLNQPLGIIPAFLLCALIMTQEDERVSPEYRPMTMLLIVSGLLFFAEYTAIAWGISLFCSLLSLAVLLGSTPSRSVMAMTRRQQDNSQPKAPERKRSVRPYRR